jgi:hypothetical protein
MKAAGICAAALALAVAAPARPVTSPTALHGFVTKGLLTPVCRPETPCVGPAAGATLVFTDPDGRVFRAVTRATGFYRLALPAGTYTVVVRGTALGQAHLSPKRARAVGKIDGRLDFYVDTGIQ